MRLGLVSTIFSDLDITTIVDWTLAWGLDALELDYRRHVLGDSNAKGAINTLRSNRLEISAFTVMGALLDSNEDKREETRRAVKRAVQEANAYQVPNVVIFVGRDETLNTEAHEREVIKTLSEICHLAESLGVRVLIENWPGQWKNYAATTPVEWGRLFALPELQNLGLAFDPSHLALQGIDCVKAIKSFSGRIFLVHGKDVSLNLERRAEVGYFGDWWNYRLPGEGDLNWFDILGTLKLADYQGVVSVEHEDFEYGWQNGPLEKRKEGVLVALSLLRKTISSL
jgi:sugar phosphate isomerase/epimerase